MSTWQKQSLAAKSCSEFDCGVGPQANGSATPRSASRRAPAPMPAAAKEALTENGGPKLRPTRPANGKASPAKKPAAGDSAWTEQQELALVQVRQYRWIVLALLHCE